MEIKDCIKLIKKEFSMDNSIIDSFLESSKHMLELFEYEDKGFVLYMIIPGFTGRIEFMEVFMYLKTEHRNIANLNSFLTEIETLAISKHCDIIKIGSNSGYNDRAFITYLKRKKYIPDTMVKEL